ncbi:DUF6777 domain-containing protein [Nocardioides sp.]|uniref:DUF6777 domain-containing protein n=1 Tax=Nocardioides sp. TaxID=35761 RepID=UPI003566280C
MPANYCPNCGSPVQDGAQQFCPNCGHQLSSAAPEFQVSGAGSGTGSGTGSGAGSAVQARTRGSNRVALIVLGVLGLVLAVVAAGALVWVIQDDGDSPADSTASAVVLEPTALEVPNPFTESVADNERALPATPSASPTPASGEAPEAATGAAGGVVAGSAPGLYGGTQDQQSCDPEALVTFLGKNPDKAAAWAAVQRIEPPEIGDFVDRLTPVNLRRDTRITNYGYVDGEANSYAAVLQAGTAVFVDESGVPRAKCSCGNPLTEPGSITTETRYTGEEWSGFEPASVVVVKATEKVSTFVLIDPTTGSAFSRPIGTTGDADTEATAPSDQSTSPGDVTGPSEGTDAEVLAEIQSIAGVSNGPTSPSVVQLPGGRITALQTYHWNNAQGDAPGTIGLRASDGTTYGPFPTTGSDGQGGVPNAYWTAITNFRIPAGSYTVVDSNPATWAWTPDTGGRGMVRVWGVPDSASNSGAQVSDKAQQAVEAVRLSLCPDVKQYVGSIRAREVETDLFRVEVKIVLDSGQWTAKFDADFATEFGPEIRPVNDNSADLLC